MTKQERQAREATFPKCKCGNTLGLERVHQELTLCASCEARFYEPSSHEQLLTRIKRLEKRVAELEENLNILK